MINAVLTALPTSFLSFFALPRWVERKIDTLRRKFLQGGTQKDGMVFCLVNWKQVCKQKEFGGLGFINLRDFNKALLLKWWWKLFDDPMRIWAMLVSQSYPPSGQWPDRCINGAYSSPFWKGMALVKDIFFQGIAKEVKGGRGLRFWLDRRCSHVALGCFSRTYSLQPKTPRDQYFLIGRVMVGTFVCSI